VHWNETFFSSHCLVAVLQYPEQHAVSLSHAVPVPLHFSWHSPAVALQKRPLQQLMPAETAEAPHFSPAPKQEGISLHVPRIALQYPEQHALLLLHALLSLVQVAACAAPVALRPVAFGPEHFSAGFGTGHEALCCWQATIDAFAHATAFMTDALAEGPSVLPLSSLNEPSGSIVATPTAFAPPSEYLIMYVCAWLPPPKSPETSSVAPLTIAIPTMIIAILS
jgi:hypothetical protein